MPKKKNKKQNNETPLEKLAKKILVNSQKAFYFGANNKGSAPDSCIQAKFIEEKINSLANNDNLFEIRLKKVPIRYLNKIKSIRQQYIKEKKSALGLELLSFFYDTTSLKKQFEVENKIKNIKWNDGWLNDLKDLQLIWATSYSEQYRKENGKIFSKEHLEIYSKLRIDGIPDEGEQRQIYFKRTLFDIKAATLHGAGACELMAEFALFNMIQMSKTLACPVYYIRFLSTEYEEINAIALGNWPNEDSLVVCPWLEKGESLLWKGDLQTTRFSNYSEANIKVIFKIVPGIEMDQWREALQKIDFLTDTDEKQSIKNRVETLSKEYQDAFKKFFIKEDHVDNNSSFSRRIDR